MNVNVQYASRIELFHFSNTVMVKQFLFSRPQKPNGPVPFNFQVKPVIAVTKLDGSGDDLFEPLRFGRVGSELIQNIMHHFESLVGEVWLEQFVHGFARADDKAIGIDFKILGDIRWKFHFKLI